MNLWIIMLLAISLSMDTLGISISYGIRKIKIPLSARLIICFISVLFTYIAVSFGNIMLMVIPANIAKLIGSGMMLLLGIFIIYQSVFAQEKNSKKRKFKNIDIVLKPLGITIKIIRNPAYGDLDKSKHIDPLEAIYLGTALSIDSFAAGISTSISGINSSLIPIAVGACQLIFLFIGVNIGKKIVSSINIDSKYFVLISGLILVSLAIVRFFV